MNDKQALQLRPIGERDRENGEREGGETVGERTPARILECKNERLKICNIKQIGRSSIKLLGYISHEGYDACRRGPERGPRGGPV